MSTDPLREALEAAGDLQWVRLFLSTREKAHPDGLVLFDETMAQISAALSTPPTPAEPAPHKAAERWTSTEDRVPDVGTECLVLVRFFEEYPTHTAIDTWDVQYEDPTGGMGGPPVETGQGWNDNYESDVLYWMAVPDYPSPVVDPRDAAIAAKKEQGA